jgi:thiol-disulfide isomerase/thioredoxin
VNKVLIILSLLLLAGCAKADQISDDYPLIKDRKHIFQYTNATKVIEILKGESKKDELEVIVFTFPECPWCQESLPRVNQVAKELAITEVLLLNVREMRDLKTPEYMEIFELVKDDIEFGEGSKERERINVPTIIVVKNGEIVGSHLSTVASHAIDENKVLPPMTDEQDAEFKAILRNLFAK